MMANRMHRQGLEGRAQKIFDIFDVGILITQKWGAIAHENCQNEAYARFGARFTLQMGRTSRDGQQYA